MSFFKGAKSVPFGTDRVIFGVCPVGCVREFQLWGAHIHIMPSLFSHDCEWAGNDGQMARSSSAIQRWNKCLEKLLCILHFLFINPPTAASLQRGSKEDNPAVN